MQFKIDIQRRETPFGQQWVAYTYTIHGLTNLKGLILGLKFTGENAHEMHDQLDEWESELRDGTFSLEKRRFESGVKPTYPDYAILYKREEDGTLTALARTYYSHSPQLNWEKEIR